MRGVVCAAVIALAAVGRAADPADAPPTPLPDDVVKAWTDAGAKAGWFDNGGFRTGGEGRRGEVPGFRFDEWKAGVIGKLPAPDAPFGLFLHMTKVTDDGLKELAGLKLLTHLSLYGSREVTDAGVKHLAGLKDLTYFDLYGVKVTDAGLKHLTGLTKLTFLDLYAAPITDAGLKELAKLGELTTLRLYLAEVTDAGMKDVAAMKKLTALQLANCDRLTDAGLVHLAGLSNLRQLSLGGNQKVTAAGVGELKKSLPKCNISR